VVGQPVTVSASVTGGDDAAWRWSVTGASTASSSATGPFTHSFAAVGTHTVTLTVENEGGRDEQSVTVQVQDTSAGTPTPDPLDLSVRDTGVVQVPYPYCDTSRDSIAVQAADGLSATGDWEGAGSAACRFVVSVTRDGIPGGGGLLPDALSFIVNGGSGPSVDVLVPEPPEPLRWNGYAVCLNAQDGRTQFLADFTGPDLPSLAVRLTVGGRTWTMDYVDGGSGGHGEFWSVYVATAELPDVEEWRVSATDGSASVGSDPRPRGTCW
jgi:hypothetical protein